MKVNLGFKKLASLALALVVTVGLVASANAQKILFDLGATGDFRSVSVPNPDPNGNYWNSVSSCCYFPGLVDTNGNPTTVNFGFTSATGNDSYNGPAGPTDPPPFLDYLPLTDIDAAALGDLGVKEAAFDFYTGSKFQIQNLDPSKKYNLTLFGSHQYNDGNNTTRYTSYTIGFASAITSADLVIGGDGFWNRDQVATLSNLSPQADGILYIGFAGAPRGGGYLNSMELTPAVPEPSTLLLMGGAVASGLAFRRRK